MSDAEASAQLLGSDCLVLILLIGGVCNRTLSTLGFLRIAFLLAVRLATGVLLLVLRVVA